MVGRMAILQICEIITQKSNILLYDFNIHVSHWCSKYSTLIGTPDGKRRMYDLKGDPQILMKEAGGVWTGIIPLRT
jgi:hypothetical protein